MTSHSLRRGNVELRIPPYVQDLREALLRPHHVRNHYRTDAQWAQHALEAMMAPYDARAGQGVKEEIAYVRPQTSAHVERKTITAAERYVDIAALHRAARQRNVPFERLVMERAEQGRPLSPTIEHAVPTPEQRLLAAIVAGDRAHVFKTLDAQPNALIKLYNGHTLLQPLAFCPDARFRREFIERYAHQLNKHRQYTVAGHRGVSPVLRHQVVGVGHEVPGLPSSVYAQLGVQAPECLGEQWLEVALSAAKRHPGVYVRIGELAQAGVALPEEAIDLVVRGARGAGQAGLGPVKNLLDVLERCQRPAAASRPQTLAMGA